MPNNYIIFRKGNSFLFAEVNGSEIDTKSFKEYKKIIKRFMDKGYTITYNDKAIILKSKRRLKSEPTQIAIMNDERLLKSKYLKNLKKDMARVKKTKGYTIIETDAYGNKTRIKKTPKKEKKTFSFASLFHDRATTVGIAITLVAIIASYGLFSSKTNQKTNDNLDQDAYSISMTDTPDASELFTDFNDISHNNLTPNVFPFKLYPFDRSYLRLEDFLDDGLNAEEEESLDEEENIYDEYLETYAEYFHLDADKVIDFARQVTNNYTLAFEDILGTDAYDIDNPEAACMIFVHELNRDGLNVSLSDYGLTPSDFVIDPNVTALPSDKVLSNGQTFEEFFGHVCDLLNVDKNWLLGITYLETGRLTSNISTTINNFGGLRGTNGFYTYISPEAGIIAHCRNLKRYENFDLQSIYELAGLYVYGDSSLIYKIYNNPNDPTLASYSETMNIWINSVTYFHDDFLVRSEEVFGKTELDENDDVTLAIK